MGNTHRKALVISGIIFYLSSSVFAVFDANTVLNSMNDFLIRQMEVFDSIRPPDQNQLPLVQTFGYDHYLTFPPAVLSPPPCDGQLCAPSPLPEMKYRGDVYDQAVAACWFIERAYLDYKNGGGETGNFICAKKLLDAVIFLQDNDPYEDGRVRAAYWANNLLNPSKTESSIMDPDAGVGNMAWFGIALTRFLYVAEITNYLDPAQRQSYLQVTKKTADWILGYCKDVNSPFGFRGGFGGWSQVPYMWKSTEHNIDVYVFAKNLYRLDGDLKWAQMACHAQKLVKSMFNPIGGYYYTGTLDDGITTNLSPVPSDAQSWSALAKIDVSEKRNRSLEFLARPGMNPNDVNDLLIKESCDDCCDILGIKFSDIGTNIQCEATAGTAMAFLLEGRQADSCDLLESLDMIRLCAALPYDGITDGIGIVATPCLEGAWTGYGQDAWYYKLLHVASSAWTGLAVMVYQGDTGANPLEPLLIPGDFNRNDKVDFIDFAIFAQNYPCTDCQAPCGCAVFDLNQDNLVGISDLEVFCRHWLESNN